MATTSSNNIKIQPHNHDLTSLLSITETQTNRGIDSRYGINFNDVSIINDGITYKFTRSDNLLDDLSLIEMQIQKEIAERTAAITDIESRDITKKQGLIKLGGDGGGLILNDSKDAVVDTNVIQEKLVGEDGSDGQNIKTINNESLLISGPDDKKNIELPTLEKVEELILELKNTVGETTSSHGDQLEQLQGDVSSLKRDFTASMATLDETLLEKMDNYIKTLSNIQNNVNELMDFVYKNVEEKTS